MDLNFLQGAGLFLCVAGIVMVVLLALAVRAFTSNANRSNPANRDVFNERGRERPTYYSERVQSRGGFGSEGGSIPQTGFNNDVSDVDRTRDRTRTYDSDRLDDADEQARRRRDRRDDDDDVRSSGGFGS